MITTPSQPADGGQDMFRVDVDGLRRKFADNSKPFLLYELYQNSVDEDVTQVTIELHPHPEGKLCRLVVEDDSPEGFKDLTHSFTIFADSSKLHNPEKRGIWNLGEKLVLAFCTQAVISSTKGTVFFKDGRRFHSEKHRERGTRFEGDLLMTPEEYGHCCRSMKSLIPPEDVRVTFNGEELVAPPFAYEFSVTLPTTIGDESGVIRRTRRKTVMRLYEAGQITGGWIYEMGIPVVKWDNRWHADIQQRVPLNMQRDNVTPAYLQELRVAVLNGMAEKIEEKDVNETWVRAASSDKRCEPKATQRVLDLRFGEKRVSFDVRDREANKKALDEGYTVVSGGSMSKQEWKNAKEVEAIKPAGQVLPSNPPEKKRELVIEPADWTDAMNLVADYAKRLAPLLIDQEIRVRIVDKPDWPAAASFGSGHVPRELSFNLAHLPSSFFENRSWQGLQRINETIIHEFAHEYAHDHYSRKFYDTMGLIGARLASLALRRPETFTGMVDEGEGTESQELWPSHSVACVEQS